MANFKHKGFTYELIIKPCKNKKTKYEYIKFETGFRNLWTRISYDEYLKVKCEIIK